MFGKYTVRSALPIEDRTERSQKSVKDYHYKLGNFPGKRRSHLLSGGNLKSQIGPILFMFCLPCCHLGIILVNDQPDAQFVSYVFISILYMFRAALCSSSGESIVSIQYLVCVTLFGWPSSVQVGKEISDLHTRRSCTQSDIYQMLYWYNWFSWWWVRSCSKHVEKWNKCIRIVRQVGYLRDLYQDARSAKHKIKLSCLYRLLKTGCDHRDCSGTWRQCSVCYRFVILLLKVLRT
jgi:hypothetical protein